jgi:hypothetical protein
MDRDSEGFESGATAVADAVGKKKAIARRNHHPLAKRAVETRQAEETVIGAKVGMPALAPFAPAARNLWVHRHAHAPGERLAVPIPRIASGGDDLAHELMPENERLRPGNMADSARIVEVQIGAADANGANAD